MAETLFADVSYYQHVVNDSYPYRFIAFRANDGAFRDPNFAANIAWAKSAVARGRMDAFFVYVVYETDWVTTANTLKSMVGTPHPKMAIMIDAENWQGKIRGNHSAGLNALRENLIAWLGGNRKRVVAYANASDYANMWPQRGDVSTNLADWSSDRPAFPNKFAQQISATYPCPPFGTSDMNASPYSPAQLLQVLGMGGAVKPNKPVPPAAPGVSRVNSQHKTGPGVFRIVSPNRHYVAWFQADGNFVLYDWINQRATWSSGTEGKGATQFAIQNDGNLVIRRGSAVLWSSNTYGQGKTFLQIQDDGNLVLYRAKDNHALWVSGTKL